jgi:hypothetical protein
MSNTSLTSSETQAPVKLERLPGHVALVHSEPTRSPQRDKCQFEQSSAAEHEAQASLSYV